MQTEAFLVKTGESEVEGADKYKLVLRFEFVIDNFSNRGKHLSAADIVLLLEQADGTGSFLRNMQDAVRADLPDGLDAE